METCPESDKLSLFRICYRSNGRNSQIKRIIVFMKRTSLIKRVYARLANRINNLPVSVLGILPENKHSDLRESSQINFLYLQFLVPTFSLCLILLTD